MYTQQLRRLLVVLIGASAVFAAAQPAATNYQGFLKRDGTAFNGNANMKFVIAGTGGTVTLWSNDGTSNGGGEPNSAVVVPVARGLFSVCLGCPPMVPLSAPEINQSTDAVLRVWVNTGAGFEQLSDQVLASSPFSLHSGTADGAPGAFAAGSVITAGENQISLVGTGTDRIVTDDAAGFLCLGKCPTGLPQNTTIFNQVRVGVATLTPAATLHVAGTTYLGGVVTLAGNANAARIMPDINGGGRIIGIQGTASSPTFGFTGNGGFPGNFEDGGGGNGWYRPLANTQAWSTGNLERMRLTPGGALGIGTTTPGSPLEVVGSGASVIKGSNSIVSSGAAAIFGEATSTSSVTVGVYGNCFSDTGRGVFGAARATSGVAIGVYGYTASPDPAGYGVFAGGNLGATGTKSFVIDHPLDPENRVLKHYCAEGPEPLNVYGGSIRLDGQGEAWVSLPDYFAEINREPRIMLTPVGAAMPNLHVAQKIVDNRFQIAGGAADAEVFWEVKGVRNDRWVQTHGAPAEIDKRGADRGRYLNPELYGQPKEMGMHYLPEPSGTPEATRGTGE